MPVICIFFCYKIMFYCLMAMPLVVVLVALQFLPDQIPAHFDFNNQVTKSAHELAHGSVYILFLAVDIRDTYKMSKKY